MRVKISLARVFWAAVALSATACIHEHAAKPETIEIAVDKDGKIYWNGQPVSCKEFNEKLRALSPMMPFKPTDCRDVVDSQGGWIKPAN